MLADLHVELNGLVIKPDEVLVIVGDGLTYAQMDAVKEALEYVGLSGRALVIAGPAQLAAVKAAASVE